MFDFATIILAAGDGKRMHSATPKVLHPLCGRPMLHYCIDTALKLGSRQIYVVTSRRKGNPVDAYLKNFPRVKNVHQSLPKGTGDAVRSCQKSVNKFRGPLLILYGDVPLIRPETLKAFLEKVRETGVTLGLISTKVADPMGYGRVVRDSLGEVQEVVEEKEASEEIRAVQEVNTGIYAVKSDWLFQTLKKLKLHPGTGEYYLTDIVGEAVREGVSLLGYFERDDVELLGVNSRKDLGRADQILRGRLIDHWMRKGVTFTDPRHVYIESGVVLGADTVIHPQVHLQGKTRIGKNCTIECGAVLRDMKVGDDVHIKPYCVLEESLISKGAQVGPFARIRPGSAVGPKARVGNFVELKKTRLGDGVKANHLTYLGDAFIGANSNIGCGTITCNYDGLKKYPTRIGKNVFVGSDVQLVAPVKVGEGAYIAAGSTVTKNVPRESLAIARGHQVNKPGWVRKRKGKR